MDLIKQYIAQCIAVASSNLRLNNQRIEVIAMLRDVISKSKDIQYDLNQLKKITELSKLAIKLSEIHNYLREGNIDFLKVSDKFKEHSFNLIKELNHMLDMVDPYTFQEKLDHFFQPEKNVVEVILESQNSSDDNSHDNLELKEIEKNKNDITDDSNLRGTMPDDKDDVKDKDVDKERKKDKGEVYIKSFDSFETTILKPIIVIDSMLNQITLDSELPVEIEEYSALMTVNAELSSKNGFDILTKMHEIVSSGLILLKNKTLVPSKEVIESLRACLIVIVALVKSKEVDIKNYLNRAEVFGKFLQKIKTEELK